MATYTNPNGSSTGGGDDGGMPLTISIRYFGRAEEIMGLSVYVTLSERCHGSVF